MYLVSPTEPDLKVFQNLAEFRPILPETSFESAINATFSPLLSKGSPSPKSTRFDDRKYVTIFFAERARVRDAKLECVAIILVKI